MSSTCEDFNGDPTLYIRGRSSISSPSVASTSSLDLGFDMERFLDAGSEESIEPTKSQTKKVKGRVEKGEKSEVDKESHLLCKHANKAIVKHDFYTKGSRFHVKLLDFEDIILRVQSEVAIKHMPVMLKEYLLKVRKQSPNKFQSLIERSEELLVLFKKRDKTKKKKRSAHSQ